jgi:hypothetical protein
VTSSTILNLVNRWRNLCKTGQVKGYGGYARKTEGVFSELAAKGLLLAGKSLLAEIEEKQQAVAAPPIPIRSICVPTFKRNAQLEICLKTFSTNLLRNNRPDVSISVMSDSEDADTEELVRIVKTSTKLDIHYYGVRRRMSIVDALARKSIVPRDVLEFALGAQHLLPSYGNPSRNLFALMNTGKYAFHTDDDTRCSHVALKSNSTKVTLSGAPESCETYFYSSHDELLRGHSLDSDFDILGEHEKLLGKSVATIVGQSHKVQWKEFSQCLSSSLDQSHIDITSSGCLGDAGLYTSGSFIVGASDETLARMCQSDESYEKAAQSFVILRASPEIVISRGRQFQSMSYGVDYERLQPPFFPAGRNSDNTFWLLCLISDSRSWLAHLPIAIYHRSDPGRGYLAPPSKLFSPLRLNDVLMLCLQYVSLPGPTSRSTALPVIGEQLVAIGKLHPKSFKSFLYTQFCRRQLAMARMVEQRLASHSKKYPRLTIDLTKLLSDINGSVLDAANIVPKDVRAMAGDDCALETAQSYVGLYGKTLIVWERLVSEFPHALGKED